MTVLVTGGAGFIGANFVLDWLAHRDEPLCNLDKLTYAGHLASLAEVERRPGYAFVRGDIADRALLHRVLATHRPRAVVHFAAESHVDRSIDGPAEFIQTNLLGTFSLLEEVRGYWGALADPERGRFRFLHVSTDEVYGSLGRDDPAFTEATAYAPNSPYAASKAGSDHLVRAYHHTYGLPVLTTNCSNNYGPLQFPDKLIPLMILNAVQGKPLPVYGDGKNVRDWLYVRDHCAAIRTVLEAGVAGEVYNIGGAAERENIEVVRALCGILDELRPRSNGGYAELVTFVKDRPGHDRRYAVDASKIARELDWAPTKSFEEGLRETVRWYLDHPQWIESVQTPEHRKWMDKHYTEGGA